jgi:AcrR family transcriptional regulator
MARTINRKAHASRRDQFVDAAQALMTSKGYEQVSIQDVLAATGASKGAFYHYFGSKADLLEAIVDRMTAAVLADAEPLLDGQTIPAPQKLRRLFGGISSWKTQRKEMLLALLETWYSDENIVVREKFRRHVTERMTPVLSRIIEQGNAEGTFHASRPSAAAEVFVALLVGLNERAGHLFLASQAGEKSLEEVVATFTGYADALERIVGTSPGSLELVDPSIVREWFGAMTSRPMLERSATA